MKLNPGNWSEPLLEAAKTASTGIEQTLRDCGKETAAAVMSTAQEWVSSFTVVIVTSGTSRNSKQTRDMTPGTGVTVRLNGNMFGVLTAAHVLRRGDNTKDKASVTVLVPPTDGIQGGDVMAINLGARPCTVAGFHNESEEGPDIAIIPLSIQGWRTLEGFGMVAYNLGKQRWSDEDKAKLGEMNPWFLSIVFGIRCQASEIVHRHSDRQRASLAVVATNTRIDIVGKRAGYDYVQLPVETTPHSYPTYWKNELPGTAAQEIDELDHQGVTRQVWGGTSGAGVWNLAIGTTQRSGLPNGTVLAQLAGICFYANPDKGCIIAHGTESLSKIAASHIEKEALRYHSKA